MVQVQVSSFVEAYHRVVMAPRRGRRRVVVGQLRPREASAILELVSVAHGADDRWHVARPSRMRRLVKAVDLLILLQLVALPALHPYPVQRNCLRAVRAYAMKLHAHALAVGGTFSVRARRLALNILQYVRAARARAPNANLFALVDAMIQDTGDLLDAQVTIGQ